MKCQHFVATGTIGELRQCKHEAKAGYNLCHQHGWFHKYFIQFTWQDTAGDSWKLKKKAIWPILFNSRYYAEAHMATIPNIFKNLTPRRKLSCCVQKTKAVFPQAQLRKVPK